MKTIIVLLSLLLSGSIVAQNGMHKSANQQQNKNLSPEEKGIKDAEKAEKKLSLNADQKVKWQNAATSRAQANTPLRQKMDGSTTPEERKSLREDMQKNNQKFESEITQFLTAEQLATYQTAKNEKKAKGHSHNGKHATGSPASVE